MFLIFGESSYELRTCDSHREANDPPGGSECKITLAGATYLEATDPPGGSECKITLAGATYLEDAKGAKNGNGGILTAKHAKRREKGFNDLLPVPVFPVVRLLLTFFALFAASR